MLIYPWGTNSFSSNHRASRCHHLVKDILVSMWDKSWRCYWKEKTKGALILTAARQNVGILFWQTLKNRLRRGRIFIFLLESHTLKNSKPALELKPWEGTLRGPQALLPPLESIHPNLREPNTRAHCNLPLPVICLVGPRAALMKVVKTLLQDLPKNISQAEEGHGLAP